MRLIRGFTPNWFTVGMGTGILALDAYMVPQSPEWLRGAGTVMWLVNLAIVALLCGLLATRSIVDRRGVKNIFTHPLQSMFFGAIPMAMTTVVNGFFDMGPTYIGPEAYQIGAVLWILNAVVMLGSVFVIPFLMFISHNHALSKMTGAWLMPIVPAEVTAASSGLLIPHVASLALRQDLFIGTIVLWAFSVPLAFFLLGVLFLRMAVHKLPPADLAVSIWITLGTLGTGIMGLMLLAKDAPLIAIPAWAAGLTGAATFAAVVLWGLGLWWFVLSSLITGHYVWRRSLPFNLGWWGLTFPIGVYTAGTDLLYHAWGTPIFGWASRGLFGLLVIFWIIVAALTIRYLVGLARRRPVDQATGSIHPIEDVG